MDKAQVEEYVITHADNVLLIGLGIALLIVIGVLLYLQR